jgi:hypothetical protein
MEEKRYLNEAFKKVAEFINISEEQLELILDMMSQNPYLIFRATSISLERQRQKFTRVDSKIRNSPVKRLESFNANIEGSSGINFYRPRILML